ncbi:MAG: hypothetical protein IJZ95_08640 [Oscillospiraceae bacterium]|nr:hypothetical protein [Oscillospiraceae bacterium]
MERFCHKCGSLVSGTGAFCPLCGEAMDVAAVSLTKPEDNTNVIENDIMPTGAGNTNAAPVGAAANSQMGYAAPQNNTYAQPNMGYGQPNGYAQPNPNMAPYPAQPMPYNNITAPAAKEMTVGEWVLTIFLSGLGIIGLVLLFVWGFGNDTPIAKKNYARAMLIWQAIAIGLVIIMYVFIFAIMGITMAELYS